MPSAPTRSFRACTAPPCHAPEEPAKTTYHLNVLHGNRSTLSYNFFHLLCARPVQFNCNSGLDSLFKFPAFCASVLKPCSDFAHSLHFLADASHLRLGEKCRRSPSIVYLWSNLFGSHFPRCVVFPRTFLGCVEICEGRRARQRQEKTIAKPSQTSPHICQQQRTISWKKRAKKVRTFTGAKGWSKIRPYTAQYKVVFFYNLLHL